MNRNSKYKIHFSTSGERSPCGLDEGNRPDGWSDDLVDVDCKTCIKLYNDIARNLREEQKP